MLTYLLVLFSLAVVLSVLVGAVLWTIKLGVSPAPPEGLIPAGSSFGIFPWAIMGK